MVAWCRLEGGVYSFEGGEFDKVVGWGEEEEEGEENNVVGRFVGFTVLGVKIGSGWVEGDIF